MNPIEQFVATESDGWLAPGERIVTLAVVQKRPNLFWQLMMKRFLLSFFVKTYFAVVTNQRIVLLRTELGRRGPALVNRGMESIDRGNILSAQLGSGIRSRSIKFELSGGGKLVLWIDPNSKHVPSQETFLTEVSPRSAAAA